MVKKHPGEGRIIGGKKYRYQGWFLTKALANKRAKRFRKEQNAYARVVHDKAGGYSVWVRFK